MTMNYTFLDLETSGLDRFHDQVLEFSAITKDADGNLLDSINESCRTEMDDPQSRSATDQ